MSQTSMYDDTRCENVHSPRAEEEVGAGESRDEEIVGRMHLFATRHRGEHEQIARDADEDNDGVGGERHVAREWRHAAFGRGKRRNNSLELPRKYCNCTFSASHFPVSTAIYGNYIRYCDSPSARGAPLEVGVQVIEEVVDVIWNQAPVGEDRVGRRRLGDRQVEGGTRIVEPALAAAQEVEKGEVVLRMVMIEVDVEVREE